MKTTIKYLLFTVIVFTFTLNVFSQVPNYVPISGLVGYWPFNGNANDESGNGNNGIIYANLTSDRFGNPNSAYNFNQGSKIEVPMTQQLFELPVRSFSCWFRLSANQTGGRIYETTFQNGGIGFYAGSMFDTWYGYSQHCCNIVGLSAGPIGVWHHLVVNSNDNTGFTQVYLDGVEISTSNGYPAGNGCFSNTAWQWQGAFMRFGQGASGEAYFGDIDDIAIYNRALTQQEITNLYTSTVSPTAAVLSGDATICAGASTNLSVAVTGGTAPYTVTVTDGTNNYSATGASPVSIAVSPTATSTYSIVSVTGGGTGNTGTATVTVIDATISASDSVICAGETVTLSVSQGGSSNTACSALPSNLQAGLVGYWPFCGNANDESGNGNNGTVNGASLTSDRNGNPNSAYSFNGSSDYISLPNFFLGGSTSVSDLTYFLEFKIDQLPPSGTTYTISGQQSNWRHKMINIESDGTIQFHGTSSSAYFDGISPLSSIVPNQWYCVAITFSSSTIKLYLDGLLVSTSTTSFTNMDYSWVSGGNQPPFLTNYFGGFHVSAGITNYFQGTIDEFATWNRELTASEIQQLNTLGQSTYLWSNGSTTATINVSPTSTTTYTCTVTTNGVSCTDSVTVVVNTPTIDLENDITACGTSTTLTAPSGYDSYLWSNGAITNTTTVSANGTYSCTVTQGGCSASDSIDFTLIDATISASNSTICAGQSVTLSVPQGGSSNTACAALPTNLQTGLLEYYPFCGNANSGLNNGNNGTVNGGQLTSDALGNTNAAYSFNGTNSSITFSNDFCGGQNLSQATFRLKFKVNSVGNAIWNKDGSWMEAAIYTTNSGALGMFWAYPNQYNGIETSPGLIIPNQWYDAVIIYDGVNSKVFLNGVLTTGLNVSCPSPAIAFGSSGTCGAGINRFGYKKVSCNPQSFFNGTLDEFMVYNHAITLSEIQQLYTLGQSTYLWSNGGTTSIINISPTSTTTYTCTVTTNGVSCTDSMTVVLNNPTIDLGSDVTACGTSTTLTAPAGFDSYVWSNGATTNTTTVSANGTYTCTVKQGLCSATDSIVVVLVPLTTNTTPISACDSYLWNGTTYTASGIYSGTTTNCVTESLNLTITPSSTNTTPISACDSYSWNGTTYTSSGVYTGTTANCVTQSLNLTITPSSINTTPITACDSYSWNGTTYTATGVYTVTTANCVTQSLNLTITPSSTNTTTISACNSYTWNGTSYTASGVYTGPTANCVTQSLNLTITPSSTNTTPISACDSYTWNGTTYTASGVYTGTTANCVTESLNLTITPSSTNTTTAAACDSYTWNGTTYTASGVYTGTTANCVTQSLNLTITPSSTNTTTAAACNSYTWNGTSYTASGVYTGTTTNCVTQSLNLTITPSSTYTISVSACGTYTWPNNGQTYTTSGVYTGTTANCVTQSLNLTITPNTSVTTTINANDTYTWAANGITYTASGIYTGPTSANCVTQYLNLTINSSGISEEELVLFSLYPNPVSDMLYVNLNGQEKQDYLIIDNFGAVIKRGVLGNLINEISVSQLSSGLYYFKIEGTKPRKFSKID